MRTNPDERGLEIRPEPPPAERRAVERAFERDAERARRGLRSRWWRAGVAENTGAAPGVGTLAEPS